MVGDIYLGRVEAVLPGIQAAFVDIGTEKSAFLHASDLVRESADEAEDDEEDEEEEVNEGAVIDPKAPTALLITPPAAEGAIETMLLRFRIR